MVFRIQCFSKWLVRGDAQEVCGWTAGRLKGEGGIRVWNCGVFCKKMASQNKGQLRNGLVGGVMIGEKAVTTLDLRLVQSIGCLIDPSVPSQHRHGIDPPRPRPGFPPSQLWHHMAHPEHHHLCLISDMSAIGQRTEKRKLGIKGEKGRKEKKQQRKRRG